VRRWSVLLAGTFVLAAQAGTISGLAVLAPEFRDHYGLSLTQIGVLLGVSSIGALLTLLAWGLAADRIGERTTAAIGMAGAAAALAAAAYATAFAPLVALLFLMAAFGASANTATGRAVTSWFARHERGFALGIRQTAVPVGGFAAALALPPIVDSWGLRTAMLVLAAALLAASAVAAAVMVEGPIRTVEDETDALRHPVRDRRIWRIASASSLLIVTQIAITGFVVLFLESQRDFSHGAAGAVLAGMNLVAIAGRLLAGRLSDRRGSRIGLILRIAVATAISVGISAALVGGPNWLLCVALVAGGGLSMSWNGLAVAATVETVGPGRSGAALGVQQTMLQTAVVLAPLAFAPFVSATSWGAGFAVAAVFPLGGASVLRRLRR
jgi:sugar phosphate permease